MLPKRNAATVGAAREDALVAGEGDAGHDLGPGTEMGVVEGEDEVVARVDVPEAHVGVAAVDGQQALPRPRDGAVLRLAA